MKPREFFWLASPANKTSGTRTDPTSQQRPGVSLLGGRWDPSPYRLWKPFFNNSWWRWAHLADRALVQTNKDPTAGFHTIPDASSAGAKVAGPLYGGEGHIWSTWVQMQSCGGACWQAAELLAAWKQGCCWIRDPQAALDSWAGVCSLNLAAFVLPIQCEAAVRTICKNGEALLHPISGSCLTRGGAQRPNPHQCALRLPHGGKSQLVTPLLTQDAKLVKDQAKAQHSANSQFFKEHSIAVLSMKGMSWVLRKDTLKGAY